MNPSEESRTIFIYGLFDPREPEHCRYVGKTTNLRKRLSDHVTNKAEPNFLKTKWIADLKAVGVSPEIRAIDVLVCGDFDWQEFERHWIDYFSKTGHKLVNSTLGGDGTPGFVMPKESRMKVTLANTGKSRPEEVRKKISESNKGKKRTPEQRRKLALALTGRTRPEDQCRRTSESLKRFYEEKRRLSGAPERTEKEKKKAARLLGACRRCRERTKRRALSM